VAPVLVRLSSATASSSCCKGWLDRTNSVPAWRALGAGAQIADRVQVWVKVVVKPGTHTPQPQHCEN
jgi:hypothetical protein